MVRLDHDVPSGDVGSDSVVAVTDDVRLTAWVRGRVQGVGFRWWVRSRALELGLAGTATNLDDGRVQVVAEGPRAAAEQLLGMLESPIPVKERPGYVSGVVAQWKPPTGGMSGFAER